MFVKFINIIRVILMKLYSKSAVSIFVLGVVCQFSHASTFTLREAVEHTLNTNPQVKTALTEVLAREKEIKTAKAGYLPKLDAALGVGREWTESPATGNEKVKLTRDEASLQLRQMVFDGWATSSEVERQKARYDSAFHEAQSVSENQALRTTEVYIELLRSQALLHLVTDSLKEHQNIYDQTELRLKAGVGSQADLDQIGARLALAKSNVLSGQNNVDDAKANFERVVGYNIDSYTLVEPAMSKNTELPTDIDTAIDVATGNHPTLLSAMADVDAANAQYEASKSNFYPTVQIEGDRTWNEDIDGVEGENEDAVIALRVRYNIFNGGADKARKQQTASLIQQAKEIRVNTHREVVESIRLSWNAQQTTFSQLNLLNHYIASVDSTKQAYRKQFNIGRRTLLDLLNTENELVDANRNYINTKYDWLYSQYRVLNGMGSLTKVLAAQ